MDFMNMLSQLKNNPVQFLIKNKFSIPQNFSNNPNDIIQHLMNTGQISQEQYNNANKIAKQMQNNPQFLQNFNNMK